MRKAFLLLLLFSPLVCLAQKQDDLRVFRNLFADNTHEHRWVDQLSDSKNEFTFIFSTVFVIYKEVLSSQDVDACVFTPSCSVYAIESIKQEGIVKGYFNAIDRLTRCNPVLKKDMPVDMSTGKYFDPVESPSTGHNDYRVSQSPFFKFNK
jgi:uncharacterized protein